MKQKTIPSYLLYVGLFSALTSCNSGGVKIEKTDNGSKIVNETAATPAGNQAAANSVIDAGGDSTVRVAFPANDSVVTVMGRLSSAKSKFTATIPVQNKHRLTATLIPLDSAANIRFSQVIYPNKKAGGPFGKRFLYLSNKTGIIN